MSRRSAWRQLAEALSIEDAGSPDQPIDITSGPIDGMGQDGMSLKPHPGQEIGGAQQGAAASPLATAPNSPAGISANAGQDKDPTQPTNKDQPGTGMTPAWLDLLYGRDKGY